MKLTFTTSHNCHQLFDILWNYELNSCNNFIWLVLSNNFQVKNYFFALLLLILFSLLLCF